MRRPSWIWVVVALAWWPTAASAQSPAPVIYHTFFTDAGAICAGCFLDTWASGTTTDQATYTDSALATENANPIVLDSAGRAIIYLSANNYRFRLQSAASVTIWDRDNVAYVPSGAGNTDVTATAGEAIDAGEVVYLSDGSGALTAGRWYLADADNTYSSTSAPLVGIAVGDIASAGTGTVRLSGRITGLTSLTAGESYYVSATAGALTGTPPTFARFLGGADTTTTLLLAGETGSVRMPDSDGTHMLRIMTTSNLTADRRITILPGDNDRQVTFSGDLNVSGNATINQDVSTTGDPTFDALTVTSCTGCGTAVLNTVEGRCTLTSGTSVTTSDVTAATTLYFALHKGNRIALYDGSASWNIRTVAELSIAVPATTNTMYDVFVDDNAGTPVLAATAWTNDTTRATELVAQDGVLVQTGNTDWRYVCSFRTTGVSGQTEDSFAKRYVSNYYNRTKRDMRVLEGTDTWTYTTAAWQQANASTANQLDFVVGVAGVSLHVQIVSIFSADTAGDAAGVAVGIDSTTAMTTGNIGGQGAYQQVANNRMQATAVLDVYPAVGRHTAVWLEWGATTTTYIGDNGGAASQQSGISGFIEG